MLEGYGELPVLGPVGVVVDRTVRGYHITHRVHPVHGRHAGHAAVPSLAPPDHPAVALILHGLEKFNGRALVLDEMIRADRAEPWLTPEQAFRVPDHVVLNDRVRIHADHEVIVFQIRQDDPEGLVHRAGLAPLVLHGVKDTHTMPGG